MPVITVVLQRIGKNRFLVNPSDDPNTMASASTEEEAVEALATMLKVPKESLKVVRD